MLIVLNYVAGGATVRAEGAFAWQSSVDAAQQVAAQTDRLVLVHVWAPWCGPCLRMDKEVLSRPEVARQVQAEYVCVRLNWDEQSDLANRLGVDLLPSDVILSADGKVLKRFTGPASAAEYPERLTRLATTWRGRMVAQKPVTVGGTRAGNAAREASAARSDAVPQERVPQDSVAQAAPANDASLPATNDTETTPTASQAREPQVASTPPSVEQGTAGPAETNASTVSANPAAPAAPLQSPAVRPEVAQSPGARPPVPDRRFDVQAPAWGLEGYCPVTLCEQHVWRQGDRRWGVNYQGRTYLFVGPSEQQRFLENAEHYAPVGAGNDLVLAVDRQTYVQGLRRHGMFYYGRVYLFSSEATRAQFESSPERYAAAPVMQAQRPAAPAGTSR